CYYYLDLFQTDKQYGLEINTYADRAMLLDPELGESLIAKASFYMQDRQYTLAAQYYEKVLERNPHAGWVHNCLSDIYTTYLPNAELYLKHALQGIQAGVAGQDSTIASFTYLHLSNALAQSGFIKESERYIKKSLAYNPDNLYSETLYTYLRLAENFNLKIAQKSLIQTLNKDTTRIDLIQEVAKTSYALRDYETAWHYYEKLIQIKQSLDLNIYQGEDIKIAYVLKQLGEIEESKKYLASYLDFAQEDESIYHDLILTAYYACIEDTGKAMGHYAAFSEQENYHYWFILFLEKDPIMEQLYGHPDFKKITKKIKDKFWNKHKKTADLLKGQI
ncbi:MAG: AraC family transcriptional regulator, partial [Reichenbachiella sp.]